MTIKRGARAARSVNILRPSGATIIVEYVAFFDRDGGGDQIAAFI